MNSLSEFAKQARTAVAPADDKSKAIDFGSLRIEPRLLVTDTLSVAIPHITAFSTSLRVIQAAMVVSLPAKILYAVAGVAAAGSGALALQAGRPGYFLGGAVVALAGLVIAARWPKVPSAPPRHVHVLRIETAGATGMRFAAPEQSTIETVRRLISDNINGQGGSEIYSVDFEQGTINRVPPETARLPGSALNGTGGKLTAGNGRVSAAAPALQPVGPTAPGKAANGTSNRVDYAELLPVVTHWGKHFADSGHAEIAKGLVELEGLMREGTPDPKAKSRARELSQQLTGQLGGAAEAAKLFGSIARLAG